MRKLGMDNYDDDEKGNGDLYYPSNDMDPYLKNDGTDDSEDEEIEDRTVRPNDSIIASLQVYRGNYLKVFILEELMDGDLSTGNFMAVGTMSPEIEIWDLDTVDALTPHTVLGGNLKCEEESHKDSILGIAWNKEYMNILASASADKTVKIWDFAAGICVTTLEHHDSKVQVVSWSQHSPKIILSGSFDKSVVLKDVKNGGPDYIRWSVEADVETVAWDPHNEHLFVVSLENGMVQAFDKRRSSSNDQSSNLALFTLHAHEKAVTSVSFGPAAPNFLATSSTDTTVKLWDISSNQPSCIASLNPKIGAIFSVSFSNDDPFLIAMGGSKGKIKILNTLAQTSVTNRFGKYERSKSC